MGRNRCGFVELSCSKKMKRLAALTTQFLLAATFALPIVAAWGQTTSLSAGPAASASAPDPEEQRMTRLLMDGVARMTAGDPAGAITGFFDPVISYYELNLRQSKRYVYSSRWMVESLAYMLEASAKPAAEKGDAAVYSPNWSNAWYVKGYALIELKRMAEGRSAIQSAIDLAPHNSQYLSEMGHIHTATRDFPAAIASFKAAEAAALDFSPPDLKTAELTRALRGHAYILVEQGDLDGAEALYRRCLQADNNDRRAASELRYVEQRRSQLASRSSAATQAPAIAPPVAGMGAAPSAVPSTMSEAWNAAERQMTDPAARAYVQQWAMSSIWNDAGKQRLAVWPQDKAIDECVTAIFPSPASARLLFVVDRAGIVQQAMTDQTGYIDECVKAKVVGLRIPAPPTEPFLVCAAYESRGDNKSLVAGCGARHFYKECERSGNTKSCSVRQR